MKLIIELEINGVVELSETISPDILKEKIKEYGQIGMRQHKYWEVFYRMQSKSNTCWTSDEVAPEDVPEIKRLRHQYSLREIARMYNVNLWTIDKIFRQAS